MSFPLYLASTSPRRKMLLEQLGIPFTILRCSINEEMDNNLPPAWQVEVLAQRKALSAAKSVEKGLIVGADTVVVCCGQVLGKPANACEAERMLDMLRGKDHDVFTGVAIVKKPEGQIKVSHEQTKVKFRNLSSEEIKLYVATGEPMDKAGAYAAQGLGAIFICSIKGCYFNVVGLPVARLAKMLKEFGIDILKLNSKIF